MPTMRVKESEIGGYYTKIDIVAKICSKHLNTNL